MNRVSREDLSPLVVSAISCRAQVGARVGRGDTRKPWLFFTSMYVWVEGGEKLG